MVIKNYYYLMITFAYRLPNKCTDMTRVRDYYLCTLEIGKPYKLVSMQHVNPMVTELFPLWTNS